MKFNPPEGDNPIDQGKVVGKPVDRVEGPLKVSGKAPYAYERHHDAAYGVILGSPIAVGRIGSLDTRPALAAPGVLGVVTYQNAGRLKQSKSHRSMLLAGPKIEHYDQAIAVVVAETFEAARHGAKLLRVEYVPGSGRFELAKHKADGQKKDGPSGKSDTAVGDFASGFAGSPVQVDATYTTPDHSHMAMEPFATVAFWKDGKLHLLTSNQMVAWAVRDTAATLGLKPEQIHISSPYVGGGFGAKLWVRSDAILAAIASKQVGRPVKIALHRHQMANNTTHRPATIQRVRLGATPDGKLQAIGHESWSGNLPGGNPESAAAQTRLLYAAPHRLTTHRVTHLDLPEGNAMRAPGEAVGHLALEVAMDELAEKLGMDPVELRILNDVQYDPEKGPSRPFSTRKLVECLREGAQRFGWSRRNPKPGQVRDGEWLVGMGVSSAFRNNPTMDSAAQASVDRNGHVTVKTDMTDIGTGSYTVLAQTAAEVMGVGMDDVTVLLAESDYPVSCGSGGQWGANSASSGVYAACMMLRNAIAVKLGWDVEACTFANGQVSSGGQSVPLGKAGELSAKDKIEFGDSQKRWAQASFGAHFVEVGVHTVTGEPRVRRLTGVFTGGRILNPKTARNQVYGGQIMGVGAALMEELLVDKRHGYFVNHDLAEYHVPVNADIRGQEIVFLEELDPKSSPLKAKGLGELGICGAGAAVANAIYNACGYRVREYPITLDKLLTVLF